MWHQNSSDVPLVIRTDVHIRGSGRRSRRRPPRSSPSSMWSVQNNLTLANVDADGILRGF